MKPKVFRSRVSILLLISMVAVLWSPLVSPAFWELIRNQEWMTLIPAFILLLIVGSVFGLRYIVTDEKLLVRFCGIPSASIAIADIYSVERTYNPLASAAASLKRLAVYTKRSNGYLKVIMLISPAREQEFLDTLKAINPSIQIHVTDKKGKWRIWDWDLSGYFGMPFNRSQRK